MELKQHPKRDLPMNVRAVAERDGSRAELRINATTYRNHDTRRDDRPTRAKATCGSAVTNSMLQSGWETFGAMDLTRQQLMFLADLRKGTCRATAAQDAGVIGPLIRADLVRWDDDPGEAASRRKPPGSTFTLTPLGEARLIEHETQ